MKENITEILCENNTEEIEKYIANHIMKISTVFAFILDPYKNLCVFIKTKNHGEIKSYSEALNEYIDNYVWGEDKSTFFDAFGLENLKKLLKENRREFSLEYRAKKQNGSIIWMSGNIMLNEKVIIGYTRDIDENKRKELDIIYKAQHDSLTQLYNRGTLESLINDSIEENPNGSHAFVILDIDNFKGINDNLGHLFGDAVLRDVSQKMKNIFKPNNILGRAGGDEFVALIKNIKDSDELSSILSDAAEIFRNTYVRKDIKRKISSSMGVSLYPQDGLSFDELFSKADLALYHSKQTGKNRVCFYNEEILEKSSTKDLEFLKKRQEEKGQIDQSDRIENVMIKYILSIMSDMEEDVSESIQLILEVIARYFNVSRAYIYMSDIHNSNYFNLAYEWCNYGASSKGDFLKQVDVSEGSSHSLSKFDSNGVYKVNLDNDTSDEIKESMLRGESKSILQCAIYKDGEICGYIGIDDCIQARYTTAQEIEVLSLTTRIVGMALINERTGYFIDALRGIIDASEKLVCIIDGETYEIIYKNKKVDELGTVIDNRSTCYKSLENQASVCKNCPLKSLINVGDELEINKYCDLLNKVVKVKYKKIVWSKDKEAFALIVSNTDDEEILLDEIKSGEDYDFLTKIYNEKKFYKEIANKLKQSEGQFAAITFDINKFKIINDAYGVEEGDRALHYIGHILNKYIPKGGGLCARIYSDVFGMFIKYESDEEIVHLIHDLTYKLRTYKKGIELFPTFGIYVIEERNIPVSLMFDRSSMAKDRIKGNLVHNYEFYDKSYRLRLIEDKMIEGEMDIALSEHQFEMYLQPKFNIIKSQVIGAEALARWNHPKNGFMTPERFIPLFEENGFIIKLDEYIWEEVCKTCRKWIENNITPIPISVNVSGKHLSDPDFVQNICNLVKKYNIPKSLLELEITETVMYQDKEQLLKTLSLLKQEGFILEMDDFGSGHSSLNMLKDVPVDVIKIDRGFFNEAMNSERGKDVISSTIAMVKKLNFEVIAEGTESLEQIEFLKTTGCELVQGYFYSKPIPLSEFEERYCEINDEKGEQG